MIRICADEAQIAEYTVAELAAMAPQHFDIGERVAGATGRAFDFVSWFAALKSRAGEGLRTMPTHVKVVATDEFQAVIPWEQLEESAIVYEQDGKPLVKAHPIRLYAPWGESECLNVKGVVEICFLHRPELGSKASFGFKNTVSVAEMKRKFN